jgi:hypothetical protein
MVMAGKKLALPSVLSKIPDLTDTNNNHMDNGAIKAQDFFDVTSITAYWTKPGNAEDSVNLQKKLRKGDLVRYGNTHISTLYSEKPTCDDST